MLIAKTKVDRPRPTLFARDIISRKWLWEVISKTVWCYILIDEKQIDISSCSTILLFWVEDLI